MNKSEKALLVIVGLGVVTSLAILVKGYGQMRYYDGRISKYNELKPVLEGMQMILNKNKKEELTNQGREELFSEVERIMGIRKNEEA